MPKVSIIMLTMNQGFLIDKSIRSVLEQIMSDFELIIVNDGSTDDTPEIIEQYRKNDARIIVLDNGNNRGVPFSFNRAIGVARGDYIARIDSDDAWIGIDKLEKQVRFLDNHPAYVAVGGGMIVVDQLGNELYRYLKPESDSDIRKNALITNPIANSTSLCKEAAIREIGVCNENYLYNEDWDFWLRIGMKGKLYNFPEYFSYYTMSGRNRSIVFLRQQTLIARKIIVEFRTIYPNVAKGLIINSLQLLYGYIPYIVRRHTDVIFSRLKKKFAGSFTEKSGKR